MSTTSDRLGVQAKEVSDDVKEMGDIARDAAQARLRKVRKNAAAYYEQQRNNAHGVLCNFEQSMRERLVKSVLIAAGIGVLFGRFWLRR